jgi:MFS family permease
MPETVRPRDAAASRLGLALLVLSATQSLVLIDGLPVAVALPTIGHELGLSASGLQWVVNGYTLALAGGLLLGGRCADLFGRRRLLLMGLLFLTVTTLLAGLSPTGPLLVLARVGQGLGAAMALPASLALVPALFADTGRRDRAFAIIAVVESAAWIVGALLGGVITGMLGWRYVFLISASVSVVALMLGRRVLPESRDERNSRQLDVAGAVTITAAITAVVYGIAQVEHAGAASLAVLGPAGVGAMMLSSFALVERRAAAPLIRLELLRVRQLWGASLGVAANTAAYSAAVFIGTLYLQHVRGFSPLQTGLAFLPLAVGALASPFLARLLGRMGARPLAVGGLLVCAAALISFGWIAHAAASYGSMLVPTMLVFGIAQYGTWLALVGQATSDVEAGLYGIASGVFKTSTHVGGAIAVALFAATIETVGGHSAAGAAYAAAYVAGAVLALLGALAAGLLLRRKPQQGSHGDKAGPTPVPA